MPAAKDNLRPSPETIRGRGRGGALVENKISVSFWPKVTIYKTRGCSDLIRAECGGPEETERGNQPLAFRVLR